MAKKKNPPAKLHPSAKLTPEVQDKILDSLRKGAWFATSAEAAGVDRETAKGWRRLGNGEKREINPDGSKGAWRKVAEVGPEPYRSFAVAVRGALGFADMRDEQLLAKHATEDWRAAAFRLERRRPKVFGERLRVEVDTKVQKSMDQFLKDLEVGISQSAYAEVVAFVAKTMGVQPGGGS